MRQESRYPNPCLAGRQAKSQMVLDIGTGSGAIAVILAKRIPNAKITAVDFSEDALAVAKTNAEKHGVLNRINFVLGDLFPNNDNKYDLIISNPPYIPTAEIDKLDPNVRDWEPRMALDGGKDGLDIIRRILKEAPGHLNPNGRLMFEFGFGEAEEIKKSAEKVGRYKKIEISRDYAEIPRIFNGLVL